MLTHVCSYPGCATPTDPVPRSCKTCRRRSHHWHMTEEWLPAHPECQSPVSGYHGWCYWCLHDEYELPPPPEPRPPEPPATPTHINLDTPSPANAANIILQLQSSSAGSDEIEHSQAGSGHPPANLGRCTRCRRGQRRGTSLHSLHSPPLPAPIPLPTAPHPSTPPHTLPRCRQHLLVVVVVQLQLLQSRSPEAGRL